MGGRAEEWEGRRGPKILTSLLSASKCQKCWQRQLFQVCSKILVLDYRLRLHPAHVRVHGLHRRRCPTGSKENQREPLTGPAVDPVRHPPVQPAESVLHVHRQRLLATLASLDAQLPALEVTQREHVLVRRILLSTWGEPLKSEVIAKLSYSG